MPEVKSHTGHLTFSTQKRYEMLHITEQVERIVRASASTVVCVRVTDAHYGAIYVNDNEDGLIEDVGAWLEKLAPSWPG